MVAILTDDEKVLRRWLYGEFRDALLDKSRLTMAAAMMKVHLEKNPGDGIGGLAYAIGDFVRCLIEPEAMPPIPPLPESPAPSPGDVP